MQKMKTRIRSWIEDHKDGLVYTGVVSGVVVIYGAFVYVAVKQQSKEQENFNRLMRRLAEANSRGDTVLPGPNGGYWIIETIKEELETAKSA